MHTIKIEDFNNSISTHSNTPFKVYFEGLKGHSVSITKDCPNKDKKVKDVQLHFRNNHKQLLVFVEIIFSKKTGARNVSCIPVSKLRDLVKIKTNETTTGKTHLEHADKLGLQPRVLIKIIYQALMF